MKSWTRDATKNVLQPRDSNSEWLVTEMSFSIIIRGGQINE